MKKRLLSLMAAACLVLTACQLPQLNNGEEGSVDATSSEVSEFVTETTTEKTTYVDNFGNELSISGNDVTSNDEVYEDPEGEENSDTDEENPKKDPTVPYVAPVYNEGKTNLSVPTYIECYDGLYFIVDCYNNQVIFSESLDTPLYDWQRLDAASFNQPHTIAFDGEVYMVDDTDNNRIVAYTKQRNSDGTVYFTATQEFADMGERPHYILYVKEKEAFYAWSSMSGQMWVFKRSKDASKIFLDESYSIPSLRDVYVRSFTIIDDKVYFVSGIHGDGCIYEVDFDTFEVIRKIPVAPEIAGMVQITKIQDYFYITVSTSLYGEVELRDFIRTDSLDHLQVGQYESYLDFVTGGFAATPYNITQINGSYYMTLHRDAWGSGVVSFDVINNELCNLKDYFY